MESLFTFEAEPFQGYTEFDEMEAETEESFESSGEMPRGRPSRTSARRPPARPRRRPQDRSRRKVLRPTSPVSGPPAATLNIAYAPWDTDYQADGEPAEDGGNGQDAASPPEASAGDGADFAPSEGQSEFEEWEWFNEAPATPALPAGVSGTIWSLLERGLEWQAIRLAMLRGEWDGNRLTNQVFFSRHKEHEGKRIGSNEPRLAVEWREIQETIVRPMLAYAAQGSNARVFFGVDAYFEDYNNKSPDWGRAKSEGTISFAFIKASQGLAPDPAFKREWPRIKDAGIVRGAYMFLNLPSVKRPNREDPAAQAKKFIEAVGPLNESDLPPALDVEFPNGRAKTKATAQQCLADVRAAWNALADKYGVAPIIYTSARVWREDLGNLPAPDLIESPLWLTPYITGERKPALRDPKLFEGGRNNPPVPSPWGDPANWWIHQYQGDARQFPGIFQVDMDRFNTMSAGALGERVKWVQRRLGISQSGNFDAVTEQALRAFQQKKGLAADGLIDPRTFAFLCWSNPGSRAAAGGANPAASKGQSEFDEWEWYNPEAFETSFE
jgi:hypothetical protein